MGLWSREMKLKVPSNKPLELNYYSLGERGFSSIEAFDASGLIWSRHFWTETGAPAKILRVTWGGARVYDRYREAVWNGVLALSDNAPMERVVPFGGLEDNPEDYARATSSNTVAFSSKTSGDLDGVNIIFQDNKKPSTVSISGSIGGYVKVGDALAGNPHKAQPAFDLEASWEEAMKPGWKAIEILGGAELFVRVEAVPDVELPRRVQGDVTNTGQPEGTRSVYFVGRGWSGGKVVTSPIFLEYV